MKAETGRFWTMDMYEGSIHDPLSMHKYMYVASNPANKIDPSGKFAITMVVAAALVIAALLPSSAFARSEGLLERFQPDCVKPKNPDLWGRAFNPTTANEHSVWRANSMELVTFVIPARNEAFDFAESSGLAGEWLGPQDALRHCFWNCLTTQLMRAFLAEQFATSHENSHPNYSLPEDNQMDLHNNAIGRILGSQGGDCRAKSRSALLTGQLRTVRRSFMAPCIGASDQPWP